MEHKSCFHAGQEQGNTGAMESEAVFSGVPTCLLLAGVNLQDHQTVIHGLLCPCSLQSRQKRKKPSFRHLHSRRMMKACYSSSKLFSPRREILSDLSRTLTGCRPQFLFQKLQTFLCTFHSNLILSCTQTFSHIADSLPRRTPCHVAVLTPAEVSRTFTS